MRRNDALTLQQTQREANLQTLSEHRSKDTNDIKPLLLPWFSFRLYMVFSHPDKSRRHFYGNEHQVTYNQCLHGKVPNIVLRKSKGYTDLIRLVEKTFKGKYQSATIYMRSPGSKDFDVVCRRYFKGQLQDKEDPLISDDEGFTLYFFIKEGKLAITETDPEKEDFKINLQ